jgi:hypothetical protein
MDHNHTENCAHCKMTQDFVNDLIKLINKRVKKEGDKITEIIIPSLIHVACMSTNLEEVAKDEFMELVETIYSAYIEAETENTETNNLKEMN